MEAAGTVLQLLFFKMIFGREGMEQVTFATARFSTVDSFVNTMIVELVELIHPVMNFDPPEITTFEFSNTRIPTNL